MSKKDVYQTNSEGIYLHTVSAEESPLEPGVYLIPAGCVEVAPPVGQFAPPFKWVNGAWEYGGKPPVIKPPTSLPPVVPEEMQYMGAIQVHIDNTAQLLGYDNIQTAVTYADEPAYPKFQLEGKALRAWRSLVWAYTYEQAAKVAEGLREQPPLVEFLLELPELQPHLNPPIIPLTITQVDNNRKVAYANPLTGSDRWFAEASRLTIMGGTTEEIDEAKAQGVARYEEIQLENPWP